MYYFLQSEEFYTRLVHITQHQIGFDDAAKKTSQDSITKYLKNIFQIDDETHKKVLGETRQMKVNIFYFYGKQSQEK